MFLRRLCYRWLFPAAFVLPLWLLLGWGIFTSGGITFLWVLFIAMPSVFVGQLFMAVLVRARPTVRHEQRVSWLDVAGFGIWHALTVAVGFFNEAWFAPVLVAAILVGIGLVWLTGWQLVRESQGGLINAVRVVPLGPDAGRRAEPEHRSPSAETFIVTERSRDAD